jgi:hypothetical protein
VSDAHKGTNMQGSNQKDTEVWETNELLMAAALSCLGHSPIELYYNDDARSTYWRYEKTPELLSVVAQFALDRCRVEPKKFNQVYVGLKDEMFNFMREEGVAPRARARA